MFVWCFNIIIVKENWDIFCEYIGKLILNIKMSLKLVGGMFLEKIIF